MAKSLVWQKVWVAKCLGWQNVCFSEVPKRLGGKMSSGRMSGAECQNVGESEKVVELILFYLIQTSNKSNLISKLLSNQINLNFGQIIKSSGLPTHIGGESRLVAAE